jgi:hypothetical protein
VKRLSQIDELIFLLLHSSKSRALLRSLWLG